MLKLHLKSTFSKHRIDDDGEDGVGEAFSFLSFK